MDNERRWYEKAGEAGDVVVSTRVRLARNLRDIPFPSRMNAAQRAESERRVRDALFQSNSPIAGDFDFLQMDAMSEQQAGSLVEKHLISPQFAANFLPVGEPLDQTGISQGRYPHRPVLSWKSISSARSLRRTAKGAAC